MEQNAYASCKRWNLDALKTFVCIIEKTGTIDRRLGSGRPRTERTPAIIDQVEDLALSQAGKPQTHSTQWQIS